VVTIVTVAKAQSARLSPGASGGQSAHRSSRSGLDVERHVFGAQRIDSLRVVAIARLDPSVGRRLWALGAAFVPVAVAVFARTDGMRNWPTPPHENHA